MSDFLVYEHWRPDTGKCFYVGKGKLKRARSFEARNSRYARIIRKLRRLGLSPIIKIINRNMSEAAAFAVEVDRIAFWRSQGHPTANFTDGGDGASGNVHSLSTRDKIRKKAIGRKASAETIAKMIASRTGTKRSVETKEKMRQAALRVQSASRKAVCATKAGRARMVEMSKKAAIDPDVRKLRSSNAKNLWADPAYREKVMAARAVSRSVVKGFS